MKLFKKLALAMLIACSLVLVVPVISPLISDTYTVEAASVKINKTSKKLYVGEAYKLKVTGTKSKIKWSSSKKSVASVDKNGRVTAKKAGTATIKAKVGKKTYSCKVTVKNYYKSKVKATVEKLDTKIVVTFKNNNSYAVRLYPTVTFYNEKGKEINNESEFNYCLEAKSKTIMIFKCYDQKTYWSKKYASYKIDMGKIEQSGYKAYASKIKTTTKKKDKYLEVKAKNNSGKKLDWINITATYYNKKGKLIDAVQHYAYCNKKRSKDIKNFDYPYDIKNNKYIKPAKYKINVNYAYSN